MVLYDAGEHIRSWEEEFPETGLHSLPENPPSCLRERCAEFWRDLIEKPDEPEKVVLVPPYWPY